MDTNEMRTVADLWEEYKDYRERYHNFYENVHGDMLDFGEYLMLVDRFEDEMPALTEQARVINPMLLQSNDSWYFIRNEVERGLWQRIADLENAMAL